VIPLDSCFAASASTPAFQADVRAYADFREAPRVVVVRAAPRVKVLRVIAQLVTAHPELAVDRVRIEAVSGCADYRGTVTAEITDAAPRAFAFVWDCAWRATREGWVDARGAPDQARAAREFGWRCFSEWTSLSGREGGDQLIAAEPGA
jgi:hypothetical protein